MPYKQIGKKDWRGSCECLFPLRLKHELVPYVRRTRGLLDAVKKDLEYLAYSEEPSIQRMHAAILPGLRWLTTFEKVLPSLIKEAERLAATARPELTKKEAEELEGLSDIEEDEAE